MTEEEKNEVRKEAPCYGQPTFWQGKDKTGASLGHEFAHGECIYCGLAQPGSPKERTMKPFGEGLQ